MKTIGTRWVTGFLILCCIAPAVRSQTPRIDPAGIQGTLLLCGTGEVSQAALDRFVTLAGGDKARIVIVKTRKTPKKLIERLTAAADRAMAAAPDVHLFTDPVNAKLKTALEAATGVWLTGDITDLEKIDYREVPRRSGVVALNAMGGEIVRWMMLPDAIFFLAKPNAKLPVDVFPKNSERIVFQIEPGSAFLAKGRNLSAVGKGGITAHLAATDSSPAQTIKIQGKTQADLTVLRRTVRDRRESFPPKKVAPPVLEKGTLVIVGGGGMPRGLFKKFVDYAGGPGKANIVIFPTANADPLPKLDRVAKMFRDLGAKKATVLYGKTRAEVESKEFLDTLREATGIWFDGGRQWRFVDCYEDTRALPLMFDVLHRGGVIGGSSAGATIQGDYLCRGSVFDNFEICYKGYERGLGFLKGVAIDQHFSQRKRHKDMTKLIKLYPQYLGIGLDEATAIVVKGRVAEVVGKGKAHFYDAGRKAKKGQADFEALAEGSQYDLRERRTLVVKGKE